MLLHLPMYPIQGNLAISDNEDNTYTYYLKQPNIVELKPRVPSTVISKYELESFVCMVANQPCQSTRQMWPHLPWLQLNEKILIIAPSEAGKTTLIRKLIETLTCLHFVYLKHTTPL